MSLSQRRNASTSALLSNDTSIWRVVGVDVASPENAQRVVHALARFGAPMDQVDVTDFYPPSLIFQVGLAPRRIDIITVIDGVDFEEAWQSREAILVDGIEIFTLSRAHLLKNKLASARDVRCYLAAGGQRRYMAA